MSDVSQRLLWFRSMLWSVNNWTVTRKTARVFPHAIQMSHGAVLCETGHAKRITSSPGKGVSGNLQTECAGSVHVRYDTSIARACEGSEHHRGGHSVVSLESPSLRDKARRALDWLIAAILKSFGTKVRPAIDGESTDPLDRDSRQG